MFDVVGVGPAGWITTPWEGASSVPCYQGSALGGFDEAAGPAGVEGNGFAVQHHGDEVGVAGELADRLRGQRATRLQCRGADPVEEGVVIHRDGDVRASPTL